MYAILNNENWLCREEVLLKFLGFTEILLFHVVHYKKKWVFNDK